MWMTPEQRRPWYRLLPVLGMMALIFFLSSQPGDTLGLPDIPDLDKLLHGLLYGALALSALFALPPGINARFPRRTFFGLVLFCVFYGITDEFHQSFVPGRCPSGWDLLADTVGGALTLLLWGWWSRRLSRGH